MSFASEGIYYVRAFIDYRDSVIESNEYNNGSPVQTIEIINGQADINVEMTRSPANAMPGQSITVGSVLCNPGTRKTGDFTIGLYLSYDVTIDDQDILLGSTRKTLYNGQCSGVNSVTLSGTLPTNLAVGGDYFLVVKVDTENEVIESNENNNQTVGVPITINAPTDDLVFTLLKGPSVAVPGMSVSLNATLCNLSGKVPYQFGNIYLSADRTITPSDIKVGWHYSLPSSTSCAADVFASASIPATLARGIYYIGAIADQLDWVQELDETNNAIAGNAIRIQ